MINQDALSCIAQWIPENSNLIGLMAGVNTDFNYALHEKAAIIGDDRRYAELRSYIEDDLQDIHGLVADPETADETITPVQMFIHWEDDDTQVGLFRGPEGSVMFTSQALGWDNLQFTSKAQWDDFSPWASLPALVDLSRLGY